MGLGALRSGMMQTEFRASLIRHHRPSLQGRGKKPRSGAAPRSLHCHSHPAPSQCPLAPPSPLPGCLIPVLLPHPGHQEVPSAGELEAIDKAHLRRGRDNVIGCENRFPHHRPSMLVKGLAYQAWVQSPLSLLPPGPTLHPSGSQSPQG